jgi:hypothetical protein
MTQADWAALAAAGQAGGTQYLEALAAQRNAELAGTGATIGVPGTPGTSTASVVGADAIAKVQQQYPDLAWLLTIPDVAPLIIQAAQAGTDPTAFKAQFESTAWYQTHSDAVRTWIGLVYSNPGQAASDMQAEEADMSATLSSLGLSASPDQVMMLSQAALAQGWTDQQIKQHISQAIKTNPDGTFSFTYGGITSGGNQSGAGSLMASVDSIQAEAGKYLVPLSTSTAQAFARAIAGGTMDAQGVDAYLQQQAMSLYPTIAGAIKQGITPAQYVTPYKEVAAQLLGVSPDSIDMTQTKWNRALSQPGPDGKPAAMSLYDWQQLVMKDPQYNYLQSINAKDRASSISQGLAELFGRSPSGPAGSTAFAAAGAPRIAGVPIT